MEDYTVTTAVKIPVRVLPEYAHDYVVDAIEDYFRCDLGITGWVNRGTNEFVFALRSEPKLIDLDWNECQEFIDDEIGSSEWDYEDEDE